MINFDNKLINLWPKQILTLTDKETLNSHVAMKLTMVSKCKCDFLTKKNL